MSCRGMGGTLLACAMALAPVTARAGTIDIFGDGFEVSLAGVSPERQAAVAETVGITPGMPFVAADIDEGHRRKLRDLGLQRLDQCRGGVFIRRGRGTGNGKLRGGVIALRDDPAKAKIENLSVC